MISPAAFNTDLAIKPAGSGPFTLVSAQKDAAVVYKRWDGYWNKDAALVQQLNVSTVPDPNARFNGLRSGAYDAALISAPQDLQAKAMEGEGFHTALAVEPNCNCVQLNWLKPPFDDNRVRRAVSMAINRQEISKTLLEGLGPPFYQTFPRGFLGYDESLDV